MKIQCIRGLYYLSSIKDLLSEERMIGDFKLKCTRDILQINYKILQLHYFTAKKLENIRKVRPIPPYSFDEKAI